ncbi:MAG: ABC transporter ATP-binding protein [Gemmatimonadetes bacterium]|nr:MAG: ABC transporter ATP-binding protein [Gemmatimonadota bacterium]
MIKIVDLHKSFGTKHVLRGISMDIYDGETFVVLGRSGCGKSVMLKHIVGLLTPDRGAVYVDGEEIAKMTKKRLYEVRIRFGFLFQSGALFDSLTVAENVGLPLREHTNMTPQEIQKKVSHCLDLVGLHNIEHLNPSELSGGMRKRVGLARAIIMDPDYVLYDEPTTGLDPIMSDVINELIIRLRENLSITSIVITHDMKSAFKVADRMVMFHEGKIAYRGTPEDARTTDNRLLQQFVEGRADSHDLEPTEEEITQILEAVRRDDPPTQFD